MSFLTLVFFVSFFFRWKSINYSFLVQWMPVVNFFSPFIRCLHIIWSILVLSVCTKRLCILVLSWVRNSVPNSVFGFGDCLFLNLLFQKAISHFKCCVIVAMSSETICSWCASFIKCLCWDQLGVKTAQVNVWNLVANG